jgi:hypothetical protein
MPRLKLITVAASLLTTACLLFPPASQASAPVATKADTLRGSYARSNAQRVALNWYLSGSDTTQYWVDYCRSWSAHKVSCDANVTGESYGSLRCPSYSYNCYQTINTFTCWKTVMSILSPHWKPIYVTTRVGPVHCTYGTRTEVY